MREVCGLHVIRLCYFGHFRQLPREICYLLVHHICDSPMHTSQILLVGPYDGKRVTDDMHRFFQRDLGSDVLKRICSEKIYAARPTYCRFVEINL